MPVIRSVLRQMKHPIQKPRIRTDFNGLFGGLLCLSHDDVCENEAGEQVALRAGMIVTAFDEDLDERGLRDDLVATGAVAPSPPELNCQGSKWVLEIDENGVRHQSEIKDS